MVPQGTFALSYCHITYEERGMNEEIKVACFKKKVAIAEENMTLQPFPN